VVVVDELEEEPPQPLVINAAKSIDANPAENWLAKTRLIRTRLPPHEARDFHRSRRISVLTKPHLEDFKAE
jgi:hypothetical protein